MQLELYQQEHEEFAARGVQLLGISVDSIYSHGAWSTVRGIDSRSCRTSSLGEP